MKIRVHALISGLVQGVNFRWNAKQLAQRTKVTGWARNLDDGRVELIAEGEKKDVDAMLNELRKNPGLSKVDKVEAKEEKYKGEFTSFSII